MRRISVDLWDWYAYWFGERLCLISGYILLRMMYSSSFMIQFNREMGLLFSGLVGSLFGLSRGTMMNLRREGGMCVCLSMRLKRVRRCCMSVGQFLYMSEGMPSGPGALWGGSSLRARYISCSEIWLMCRLFLRFFAESMLFSFLICFSLILSFLSLGCCDVSDLGCVCFSFFSRFWSFICIVSAGVSEEAC